MKRSGYIIINVASDWFLDVIAVITGEPVEVEAGKIGIKYKYIATSKEVECINFIAEKIFGEVV